MQFLDLAGVKRFKQYVDEKFTTIEDHENAEQVTAAALNDLNERVVDIEDEDWVTADDYSVIEGVVRDTYTKEQVDDMLEDITDSINESPASGITSSDISNWNSKVSNVQADWTATTGDAVILHKPTLATVATSGSYNDLSNTPTIPTESTVSGWGFTKNAATTSYVDTAVAGIVNSAPATLDTLNELATALGNDPNFATTVATQIGQKQATLVSGTNIKTINNESLLGSGNISISSAESNVEIIDRTYPSGNSFPAGTYNACLAAVTAGKNVILRLEDGGEYYIYYLMYDSSSIDYLFHFARIRGGWLDYLLLEVDDSFTKNELDITANIETVKVNGTALTPDANKAVDVSIPITTVKVNNTALTPNVNRAVNVVVPIKKYRFEWYSYEDEDYDSIVDKFTSSSYTQFYNDVNNGIIPVICWGTEELIDGFETIFYFDEIAVDENYIQFVSSSADSLTKLTVYSSPQYNPDDNKYATLKTYHLTTSISSSSTHYTYPSSKAVYDNIKNLAPKASPALTGTPTAPTATAGTNTTQIATTAFVQSAVNNTTYVYTTADSPDLLDLFSYAQAGKPVYLYVEPDQGECLYYRLTSVVYGSQSKTNGAVFSRCYGDTEREGTRGIESVFYYGNGYWDDAAKTNFPADPGTLNTTATTAQSTAASEALSGSVTLHKIAKTGTFSDLVSKPTTISGYGITDAKIQNGVITLGSNTITPLTSFTETDPIFSASAAAGISSSDITNWNSKTSNTGTVTGVKINGTTKNPTSGVVDLGTVLTSYTETDPTVPSWAKQSSKPTYTAAEVGALPDTTVIPSAPGTLNTTATTAQNTAASEALSGSITLHKVAKTGTYSDLIGTPTIPTKVSDLTNDSGFTSNTGTITGITMNNASKGTSGVVDLGTVITSHAAHKLTATNGTATSTSGTITYVESLTGTSTATSGDLTVTATRKSFTLPTGVPSFSASNNGQILGVVNGALAWVTPAAVRSGSSAPSNSLGNNGDIYVQS